MEVEIRVKTREEMEVEMNVREGMEWELRPLTDVYVSLNRFRSPIMHRCGCDARQLKHPQEASAGISALRVMWSAGLVFI
ncbi:unnamed protein product [Boreogadus saida]